MLQIILLALTVGLMTSLMGRDVVRTVRFVESLNRSVQCEYQARYDAELSALALNIAAAKAQIMRWNADAKDDLEDRERGLLADIQAMQGVEIFDCGREGPMEFVAYYQQNDALPSGWPNFWIKRGDSHESNAVVWRP